MNLGDPELELIDPTPNVHALFLQFDKMFFWAKLASRVVVRWSKRMYSCAGICSYEGRGGLCDIALSEPLLKLRPRKDLIETLLHEMIHAFLFITSRDRDRDGHGPIFQSHMHRINRSTGLSISIYHDFHDEVKLYLTHWWRCDGPCQTRKPYFGVVRRSVNRAPGPHDYWWTNHQQTCGGSFVKIKEPEKQAKKTAKTVTKTKGPTKPNGDISKYINTNNNVPKSVLKDSNNIPVRTKSNNSSTLVITKKEPTFNPQFKPTDLFQGKGQTVAGESKRKNSVHVVETVRNVWASKQIPGTSTTDRINNITETVRNKWANKQIGPTSSNEKNHKVKVLVTTNPNKHKIDSDIKSPPAKIKKIDDYFQATSILQDLYGKNINLTQGDNNTKKLVAITNAASSQSNTNLEASNLELVSCPICFVKVKSQDINRHIDECLNKDVIENLQNELKEVGPMKSDNNTKSSHAVESIKNLSDPIRPITNLHIKDETTTELSKTRFNDAIMVLDDHVKNETDGLDYFDSNDLKMVKIIMKKNGTISDKSPFEDELTKTSLIPVAIKNIEKDLKRLSDGVNNFEKSLPINNIRKSDVAVTNKKPEELDLITPYYDDIESEFQDPFVKPEPGTSGEIIKNTCACCGKVMDKSADEHLEECLAFFNNDETMPVEGGSTSFIDTIVIDDDDDDDDIFDETLTLNATGTKAPCPCCLRMVEAAEMNTHLDVCLS